MKISLNIEVRMQDGVLIITDTEGKAVTFSKDQAVQKKVSMVTLGELSDSIDSEAVGAYFDVANILEFGYPQDWIKILGRRIRSIHFKDYKLNAGGASGFCNPFDGDVDWPGVKRALEKINYSGSIIAELIKPEVWHDGFITEVGRKLDYFINEL